MHCNCCASQFLVKDRYWWCLLGFFSLCVHIPFTLRREETSRPAGPAEQDLTSGPSWEPLRWAASSNAIWFSLGTHWVLPSWDKHTDPKELGQHESTGCPLRPPPLQIQPSFKVLFKPYFFPNCSLSAQPPRSLSSLFLFSLLNTVFIYLFYKHICSLS